MDATDLDGARLLAPLRDAEPAVPSTVDVTRAVRVGGRRRRTRQALNAAAAAAVVALVLALIPALVDGRHDSSPAGRVAEFDVLRQHLTVGSAGGYTPISYETGRYRQMVSLSVASDVRASADVSIYASGRGPEIHLGDQAPDVYGSRAFWLTETWNTQLAWEWARDAWVVISAAGTGEDARTNVHRIALSVRTNVSTPVRLPFTVGQLPDQLRVAGTITPYGALGPESGALVVIGTDEMALHGDPARVGVLGNSDLIMPALPSGLSPNTELNGHPALVRDGLVRIYDVGFGWDAIGMWTADGQRLVTLVGSVTPVADVGSPDSWTADPVR